MADLQKPLIKMWAGFQQNVVNETVVQNTRYLRSCRRSLRTAAVIYDFIHRRTDAKSDISGILRDSRL